jgi:hypothetical protein
VLSFMLAALLVAIYAGLHSFARSVRESAPHGRINELARQD